MRQSLIISLIFHFTVVLAIVMGLPDVFRDPEPDMSVIPVELIQLEDDQRSAPKVEQPKVEEEPPLPQPKPTPPPRAVEPVAAQEPSAMPLPEEKPKPEPKPEPKKEEPKIPDRVPANVALQDKPRPPSRFDTSRISALLNKKLQDKDEQTPPAQEPDLQKQVEVKEKKILPQISRFESMQITAGLQDAIRSQVEPCWSVPAGARDAENLQVRIRIYMRPDGDLARPPVILGQAPGGDATFYQIAAESARRAIQKCAPLKLPRERYEMWQEIELIFDPSKMIGG